MQSESRQCHIFRLTLCIAIATAIEAPTCGVIRGTMRAGMGEQHCLCQVAALLAAAARNPTANQAGKASG